MSWFDKVGLAGMGRKVVSMTAGLNGNWSKEWATEQKGSKPAERRRLQMHGDMDRYSRLVADRNMRKVKKIAQFHADVEEYVESGKMPKFKGTRRKRLARRRGFLAYVGPPVTSIRGSIFVDVEIASRS